MELRTKLFALMTSLALMTGCMPAGEAQEKEFEEFRAGIDCIGMTASLRADYGDRVSDFVLEYSEDGQSCRVEVIEPEIIGGSGAVISPDGVSMEYEGVMLSVGELSMDGMTPVTVLPLLVRAIRQWQLTDIRGAKQETDLLCVELSDMDASTATLWLDENMALKKAELSVDGYTVAYCEISDWRIN